MPHTQTPTFRPQRRRIFWLAAGSVAGILLLTGLATSMPAIERQMHRWQLLPVSQKLTELYFEDAELLPPTYQPGKPVSTIFAIANRTGRTRTYNYRVVQTDNNGQKPLVLLQDKVEVGAGYTTSVATSVMPQDLGERTSIRVVLIDENVSIAYWLDKAQE